MSDKTIYAMEDVVLAAIQNHIKCADADELARIAGELLGGECFQDGEQYVFEPNENYSNQLAE